MEKSEQVALIEALLFVAGDALSIPDIKRLTGFSDDEAADSVAALISKYRDNCGGLMIAELADGFQMVTNPQYAQWIKNLKKAKSAGKLSIAALETLALVAYKQPITKVEIEELRSVSADWTLKVLLERDLIKIAGRKDAPGKPLIFATTKEFLKYFGLKNLAELPTLKEFTKEE
ncbi:MAG: SMC-Scp complex subunit ScpB [Candidatus Magnetominusculus sp. LBB02]|nr:SMC-Scp complex subunit ScpB [Candidatus Magnetominusculus sp. LBB02]